MSEEMRDDILIKTTLANFLDAMEDEQCIEENFEFFTEDIIEDIENRLGDRFGACKELFNDYTRLVEEKGFFLGVRTGIELMKYIERM